MLDRPDRCTIRLFALAIAPLAVLAAGVSGACAWDDATYPDFKGAWRRSVPAQWDPTKPGGLRQQAPLTAEYQVVLEANLADIAAGGQAHNPQARCLPGGMPRVMIAYGPLEFIVAPGITYMRSDHLSENRRIYTDGRGFPEAIKPSFHGISLGRWIDEDGDGRYHVLEVETRGMKGPRTLDANGTPLHTDNATVVKERIYLDKANPNLLHDQITTFDRALTRPWTVTRSYRRERKPVWIEEPCGEANRYLILGSETYFMSADRTLMPTRKDQPPPDLKFFEPPAQ